MSYFGRKIATRKKPRFPMKRSLAGLFLCLLVATQATAAQDTFALWGDMPYVKNKDAKWTQAVVDSINTSDINFSIYDGDIKDGSSKCTDDVYTWALGWFNNMKAPVVYVPGDNEWTDCHRTNNGGWNNLERLNKVRDVLFAKAGSLGQKTMPLEHQGPVGKPYVENTRWARHGVVYVGVNVPGSNNNFVENDKSCAEKSARTLADCEAGNAEYKERDQKVNRWITESFSKAKKENLKGLVLVLQGDPGFDLPETEDDEAKVMGWNRDASGYKNLIENVMEQTKAFSGQVLFVHGDTHFFKMDKPLYAPLNLLPNFTRVQTFGSPNNHWVHVTVDTDRAEVFTVRPVMVKHQ
jgi:hypothetical protein